MKFFLLLILLTGCATNNDKTPAPVIELPTIIVEEPVEKPEIKLRKLEDQNYAWKNQNQINLAKKAIRSKGQDILSMVPDDYKSWCPSWPKLHKEERVQALTGLLAGMAKRESNFKTDTRYQEKFRDRNGDRIYSRGLLQLSIESSNGSRYRCGISKAEELHDQLTNLTCGVTILNYWVRTDKVFAGGRDKNWRGASRYWSTMRSNSDSQDVIKNITNSLKVCNI